MREKGNDEMRPKFTSCCYTSRWCFKSSTLWAEEAGWARSNIPQVLLQATHSLRFSPFLLTSLEVVPFYRWPTLDSQSCINFPESNIYPLPSAQAKQQPPLRMMDFQGLRTDSGKLSWYGNGVVSCPHLAWRWWWGWNPAPWAMSQEA